MSGKDAIRNIQVYDQNGAMAFEAAKGFSFPSSGKLFGGKKTPDNAIMFRGDYSQMFSENDAADIMINLKNGERVKYFCRVDVCTGRQLRLILNQERAKQMSNQRRYYRINVTINCRVADLTRDGTTTAYTPNLFGKIHDINIGGIFISICTDDVYQVGDIISFTTILGDKKLEASARILRSKPSTDGLSVGYSCCFVSVNTQQEELISSYINYLQLEERRMEIELEKMM